MPVKFISFNAICENEKISLVWKTAEEVNSSRFDIERTSNGVNWIIIGQVTASGYSQSEKTYTYNDAGPLFSGTMYRIVEYDLDGRRQYSGIVSASCDRKESIRVWPNPVEDIVRLNIYSNSQSQILLQVYDSKGALVLMQKDNLVQGSNQLTVPVQKLARGIYQLKATYQKGITKTFRLVKLNQRYRARMSDSKAFTCGVPRRKGKTGNSFSFGFMFALQVAVNRLPPFFNSHLM